MSAERPSLRRSTLLKGRDVTTSRNLANPTIPYPPLRVPNSTSRPHGHLRELMKRTVMTPMPMIIGADDTAYKAPYPTHSGSRSWMPCANCNNSP